MSCPTWPDAATLVARAAASSSSAAASSGSGRPATDKAIGISLAVASGLFIGVSFVLKKKGLLASTAASGKEAGEGMDYLKNAMWWTGMILMIIGEVCNFVAYAFVEAILVTPLGALSVVITAILSSIFLKERLSFVGKVGCFMCIIGSAIIVMNAPEQASVSTIQEMKHYVIAPGFLAYAGVIIISCVCVAVFVAPRWGNKSMMVYISICSAIGGLSVVATQGLGAAIMTQIRGTPQFNQWFLYIVLVFVVITLVTEIIYLNKALNIFNTALVTPTYYVFFTSSTIVTSAVLFRGFKGSPTSIATVVMGFLNICSGVVLLQLSKSAKDVPDTQVFRGDFDQVRIVAEQSEPESEPKADAIRGTAAIIRRISVARRTAEEEEAHRIHQEKLLEKKGYTTDSDGEMLQWDGLKRRRTQTWGPEEGARRRATLSNRPGSARLPDLEEGGGAGEGGDGDEAQQPLQRTGTQTRQRRSMSVDDAVRQQVYGPNHTVPGLPAVDESDADSFYGRVKNFFIPKTRSRASLHSDAQAQSMAAAVLPHHRDVRDASTSGEPLGLTRTRTRGYTDPNAPPPFMQTPDTSYRPFSSPSPAADEHGSRHVAFARTPSPLRSEASEGSYHMVSLRSSGSPLASPPPNASPFIPPPTNASTPLSFDTTAATAAPSRPDSRGSARRQFSFQSILHPHHHRGHGHVRERSSGSFSRTGFAKKRDSKGSRTEEEMLGLVERDGGVDSDASSEDKEANVEVLERSDSDDDMGWDKGNHGGGGGTGRTLVG